MNSEQVAGVFRVVVPVLMSVGVARGWWTGDQVGTLSTDVVAALTAVVTVVFAVWSFLTHRRSSQVDRVASLPGVHEVVVTPTVKSDVGSNPKVVTK